MHLGPPRSARSENDPIHSETTNHLVCYRSLTFGQQLTSEGTMRSVIRAVAVLAASAASIGQPAWGQAFPTTTVRLVAADPTSISATSSSIIASPLSELWKQPVVVEHRPGPGNIAAAELVAKAAPDGHTLLTCSIATHGISPVLHAKLPYDYVKDFRPISKLASAPSVLLVHPGIPATTVKEFVAYAKANPGKVQYSATGVGQSGHLAMEMFRSVNNLNVVFVPSPNSTDELVSRRVAAVFSNFPAVPALAKDGKVRPLAVASAERHPQLPDVPTLAESGYSGFDVSVWSALCAPAGVSQSVVETINAAVVKVLSMRETQQRFSAEGLTAASSTPDALAAFIKAENARWTKAAKDAGLQPK